MPRVIKISLAGVGLFVALVLGYYLGKSRSDSFHKAHFLYAAFQREALEARLEHRLLETLRERRLDVALEVTQYSYYTRLLLAYDTVQQSSNLELSQQMLAQLQPELAQAQTMMQKYPFRFPSDAEQRRWTALLQQPR